MKLLDGNLLKKEILDSLRLKISTYSAKPGLAVVLIGDNPASHAYINMKRKACDLIGIRSFFYHFDLNVPQSKVFGLIEELNQNPEVHGILVQLPLPPGYDEQKIIQLIRPEKDVDGFHPINLGLVLAGMDALVPCTPAGVCALLKAYDIQTEGKHVVILGRSNIVGKPLAALLMQKSNPGNATVTVLHSKSHDLEHLCQQADILIAAMGQPLFVKASMVKQGATVIDVGINRIQDPIAEKGYRLVGDVDFEAVCHQCEAITPVPGGVGPLTIAMLMKNTVTAYEKVMNQ